MRVIGLDDVEVHFKVKLTTNLGKIKKSYAERKGVQVDTFKFLIDGEFLKDHQTPEQLGLKDDDVIEVYNNQSGGGGGCNFFL